VNIGVANPSFSVWSGFFISPDLPIALVVEDEEQTQLPRLELARSGFDRIAGFLVVEDVQQTLQITQLGVGDFLRALYGSQRPIILDVRSAQEYDQDHLEGTVNIPLPLLPGRGRRIFSRCASGDRLCQRLPKLDRSQSS